MSSDRKRLIMCRKVSTWLWKELQGPVSGSCHLIVDGVKKCLREVDCCVEAHLWPISQN